MLRGLDVTGVSTARAITVSGLGSTDISGTPGNGTINTMLGRFAIAAAASSATITCTACTATSAVFLQVVTNDATLKSASVVPGAGSFVVTGNAAATANTTIIAWIIP